ncbi:MAG: hypothetical protein LBJ67_03485 [Planctomycetaceae bacterium]|jgi:hypothetical protein|nr:hypothetical protein [Planctomycetaceae bacterium]
MLRRDGTEQEKQTFHHLRFHHPNPCVRERFEVLWLHATLWRQLPKPNKSTLGNCILIQKTFTIAITQTALPFQPLFIIIFSGKIDGGYPVAVRIYTYHILKFVSHKATKNTEGF